MTHEERQALISALGQVIHDETKRALEQITTQLAKLELKLEHAELQARELRYCGVWNERSTYRRGNLTTHHGSLWHANIDHISTVPGSDPTGWTLCVKRGTDAHREREYKEGNT